MNQKANPLDYLISTCEDANKTGHWKLSPFDVLNAKDELNKLRQKVKDFATEIAELNQELIDEIKKPLDYRVAGWFRLNDRGDLYNPSIVYNPYLNQDTVLPIYANEKEYKEKYGKLSQ